MITHNGKMYEAVAGCEAWLRAVSGKRDPVGASLADRHYSRRKIGSPQFMPPGQTLVLISRTFDAVWGWFRPHPRSGLKLMSGLDAWTCTIFRNESSETSSDLILDAERALAALHPNDCGADGMITYVCVAKVRSSNPGYCFQRAGWRKIGWSADGKKRLLQKPFELAGRLSQ